MPRRIVLIGAFCFCNLLPSCLHEVLAFSSGAISRSIRFDQLVTPNANSILHISTTKIRTAGSITSSRLELHQQQASSVLSLLPTRFSKNITLNSVGVVTAILLLASYHIHLYFKEKAGRRTWRSAQADTREAWARYVRNEKAWLYSIQTLRNAITAQTFLATTVLSLLTVIGGRLWEQTHSSMVDPIPFALVAASMVASAYHFLQSARLMTHAGFMFPVTSHTTKADRIMRRSQNSQWLGLRCLYLSAGFLSWIVGGPKIFLVTSVLLTSFFRSIDQIPEGVDDDSNYQI